MNKEDAVTDGATKLITTCRELHDGTDVVAWLLVNGVPRELVERFEHIGTFDPKTLTLAQLAETIRAGVDLTYYTTP